MQQTLTSPDANPRIITGVDGMPIGSVFDFPDSLMTSVVRQKPFRYVVPEGDATPTLIGWAPNMLSGAAYVTPTNADFRTSLSRINTSSNAANNLIGINFGNTAPPCCRGNIVNVGGFFYRTMFAFVVMNANAQICVGLNNAQVVAGAQPSATGNRIAFAADSGDSSLVLLTTDNVAGMTKSAAIISKADLVIGDPITGGPRVLDAMFWALPNAASIHARLIDRSNNVTLFDADVTATLPDPTFNLRPANQFCNTTAVNAQHDLIHCAAYY